MNTNTIRLKVVFKNIIVLLAAKLIDYLFSFLFIIYVGRELGPNQFGQLSFAFAFTALFIIFSDLGLHRYLNREIARNIEESKEKINNAFSLKFVLSIITEIAIIISINMLGYDVKTKMLIYIFGLYVIFQSYQIFINSLFRGLQKTELEAWPTFLEKLFLLLFGILLLRRGCDVVIIALLYLILKIISSLFTFLLYEIKIAHISLRFTSLTYIRDLIKNAAPYGIFLFFGMIYFEIDRVMLSYIKGNISVGIYQAAIKFAVFLMIFPEAISEAALPNMVDTYYKDKNKLNEIYAISIKALFFIASLITIYLLFFKKWIINVTFGPDYLAAATLFPIIGGMILFRFLAYGSGAMLTATGNQGIRTFIVIACALINIILNTFFIPKYDYTGAAIATLITNIFLCIFYFSVVQIKIIPSFPILFFIKTIIISLITMSVGIFIPGYMFFKLFGFGLIFILLAYLFKILSSEEIAVIKSIFISHISNRVETSDTI